MKKRPMREPIAESDIQKVTFRDVEVLRQFTSSQNKILPRRKTGLSAKAQRHVMREIKRARELGLLPYRGQHN